MPVILEILRVLVVFPISIKFKKEEFEIFFEWFKSDIIYKNKKFYPSPNGI